MTVNDRQERAVAVDTVEINLDTLPFWPWLWADPFYGRGEDVESVRAMAEKRLRVNYETARAPIPNQYALVHRADIQTLMHEVWRLRALAGLLPAKDAKLKAVENLAYASIERRRKVFPQDLLAITSPEASPLMSTHNQAQSGLGDGTGRAPSPRKVGA